LVVLNLLFRSLEEPSWLSFLKLVGLCFLCVYSVARVNHVNQGSSSVFLNGQKKLFGVNSAHLECEPRCLTRVRVKVMSLIAVTEEFQIPFERWTDSTPRKSLTKVGSDPP
jgi:hypothetical protein